MPAPAANIDEAIAFAPNYIAQVSYGTVAPPALSLKTQTELWIAGMFSEATGIFPPSGDPILNPGQRVVTNWLSAHVIALGEIEGPAAGDAGVVGTSAVINAVERVLFAVKFGVVNGNITALQQTAVVALFNTVWA